MPRPAKGPRLIRHKHRDAFYIADTGIRAFSTGCTSRIGAEKALAEYVAGKYRTGAANQPESITCANVLAIYAEEYAHTVADPARIGYAIDALLPFWGGLNLSSVKGETCRRYAKFRDRAPGTVRRELGTLQSAINYAHKEGYVTAAPAVSLPPRPEAKTRWLTRSEAARLIWAAYRTPDTAHVARFALISLYTGTRRDAVLRMGFEPNTVGGWFDMDRGIMYRRGDGERQTKKRRPPAPIPRQLLGHLRRWKASGALWAVEYRGGRVGSIKRAFAHSVNAAGLDNVTPHTLKHTAITWALQSGATTWHCAGFFGTSQDTIEKVYGHHSPDFMQSALDAMESPKKHGF
jgi:integrase